QAHAERASRWVERARDRQASLVPDLLPPELRELGIGDEPLVALSIVVDEEAQRDPHLGGGEADTGRRIHRLEHVVHDARERPVETLHVARPLAKHRVAEPTNRKDGHSSAPHKWGSASTRTTTPCSASKRMARPNSKTRAGSSATKHTDSAPGPETSSALGRSEASSSCSACVPRTRKTGAPTGNPASARRAASARWNRSGRPVTSACTAGSFGCLVWTITRPPGRVHAAASIQEASARSRATSPGRREARSASKMATRSRPRGPKSFTASIPPTRISDGPGGRGALPRPILLTGTLAIRPAHSSTRSAPPRATPKFDAPQLAHLPSARHTAQRTRPPSTRSRPPHTSHAAGSPHARHTRATP